MKPGQTQRLSSVAPASTKASSRRSAGERAAAEKFMSLLNAGADTRASKVKRIRQSVRMRAYENELKLSIAIDRLTRDISA